MNPKGYRSRNPYSREADLMCRVLVKEILHTRTWSDMQDVIGAIIDIRQQEKLRASEWEHLNPEPSTRGMV
jgi:hypothetical protein